MNRILVIAWAALLLGGATAEAQFGPPRQPDPEVVPKERGGPYLSYSSFERLGENLERAFKDHPVHGANIEREKTRMPAGGRLHIYIEEKSEAAANPKNFTVQVTDKDGKELVRFLGRDQKSQRLGKPNLPWIGEMSVAIPVKCSGTVTVTVWNALTRKMWTYAVTPEAPARALEEDTRNTD